VRALIWVDVVLLAAASFLLGVDLTLARWADVFIDAVLLGTICWFLDIQLRRARRA